MDPNPKPMLKRKRTAPNRKWLRTEEQAILEYLKENEDIEKPTAQVYYTKLLEETGIDASWSRLRSKVRNMRISYEKAKVWKNSNEIETVNETESVDDVLSRVCPFYDDLEEIFGENENSVEENTIFVSEDSWHYMNHKSESSDSILPDIETPEESKPNVEPTTNSTRRGIYKQTAMSEILQSQAEFLDLKRAKMEMEEKLRERELLIREQEISFKERELKLKEKQVEMDMKLRREELKMKEMLAIKELELREKLAIIEARQKK